MRKKKIIAVVAAATLALSLAGCGGSSGDSKSSGSSDSSVANADKPLCWFNRQPSNSSTGELDKEALSFNKDTYYVGFDANQGAELQGQMVLDYIKANAATSVAFKIFFFISFLFFNWTHLLLFFLLPAKLQIVLSAHTALHSQATNYATTHLSGIFWKKPDGTLPSYHFPRPDNLW